MFLNGDARMGKIRSFIDYVLKHYAFLYKIYRIFFSFFFKMLGVFIPVKNNRVLFTAHGRLYNDSPKAIYEYIINNDKYNQYELIWGLENPESTIIPGRGEKVKIDSLKYFCIALSSSYWVTCVNIERGLHFKKKRTKYLNTWHGFPIKGTGDNSDGRKIEDFSQIDLFCVSGEFDREYYKKCFLLKDTSFLYSGFPRMDELYNCDLTQKDRIRRELEIPTGKKVILYAPTWRDSIDNGKTYGIKPPIDWRKWREKLSNRYVVLLRMHPYCMECYGIQYDDFVRDVSQFNKINDLLTISDLLISDYSGTIFEFAVLERPIICFGYDIDDYKKSRGLAIDLEKEIPGGVMKNEDQLLNRILGMNYEEECKRTKQLKQKYLKFGGTATQKCVEAMFGG